MPKKNNKIVRYRRPWNINIGMIMFAIIFIYLVFSVYTYMNKTKIQFYEVEEGGIVNDNDYSGIILRQEETKVTTRKGHVNYYIREGKRASVGTRIYSIDASGSMAGLLAENSAETVNLTNSNFSDIKKQLSSFSMGFDDGDFGAVYDMQYSLDALILEYVNFNTQGNLESVIQKAGMSLQQVNSDRAGVVSYAIDGFETMTAAEISEASFNRSDYTKAITKAGQSIDAGVPVYKIITSDNWSIVFPLSEEDAAEYSGKERLRVNFTSANLTAEGRFALIVGSDGKQYGKLDFNQYMVQFVSDRFIDFEIVSEEVDGLKIPVTSVTTKNFFLVPIDYISQGGNTTGSGFMKEVYSETGTTVSFTPTELYNVNDEYYFIDMSENSPFKAGDYVVKENSTDRFQIGQSASLQGVYNINKGYAVFKQIEILNSNNEYYTIKKGMRYGLTIYDHIVLDATTVYEGALIYQ